MGNIASLTVIRLVQQIKRLLSFSSLHCYLEACWLPSVSRILDNGFKQRLRPHGEELDEDALFELLDA